MPADSHFIIVTSIPPTATPPPHTHQVTCIFSFDQGFWNFTAMLLSVSPLFIYRPFQRGGSYQFSSGIFFCIVSLLILYCFFANFFLSSSFSLIPISEIIQMMGLILYAFYIISCVLHIFIFLF